MIEKGRKEAMLPTGKVSRHDPDHMGMRPKPMGAGMESWGKQVRGMIRPTRRLSQHAAAHDRPWLVSRLPADLLASEALSPLCISSRYDSCPVTTLNTNSDRCVREPLPPYLIRKTCLPCASLLAFSSVTRKLFTLHIVRFTFCNQFDF